MKASRGEIKISEILQMYDMNFKEEYTFKGLTSENGRALRFDFCVFDDDGNVELEERQSIVGENGVFVSCTLTDGSSVDISETNNITFSFNRGSGALEATYVNAVKCDENCNCRQITISKAGRTQYIVIVPVTGKIMITNTPQL